MKNACHTLIAVSLCFLWQCAVVAAEDVDPFEARTGIWSDDEDEIIAHIAQQGRIPRYIHIEGRGRAPTIDHRETPRAVELFKWGSTRLRLAIAKALRVERKADYARQIWRECRPQDYEARHYLAGLCFRLAVSREDPRPAWAHELRHWLLHRSHPGYAAALLRGFDGLRAELYEGMSDSEKDQFLPLLEALYRTPGRFEAWPAVILDGEEKLAAYVESIPAMVAKLVPHTPRGRDLRLRWLVADAKKLDTSTLEGMWDSWPRGYSKDGGKLGLDGEWLGRSDLAEPWSLAREPARIWALEDKEAWLANVARQVLSPDHRVRRAVLKYFMHNSNGQRDMVGRLLPAAPCPSPALRALAIQDAKLLGGDLIVELLRQGQNYPTPPPPTDDEKELIEHLGQHTIPAQYSLQQDSPAPPQLAQWDEEVARACEQFENGSWPLRLAIARSLCYTSAPHAIRLWQACGPWDYEARHHLAGLVLNATSGDEPDVAADVRTWLLEEAHPSYAAILLRNLRRDSLYPDDTDPAQRDRLIPFLVALYRQPGNVAVSPGAPAAARSIEEAVAELLPETQAGRDRLTRWLIADGKKVDTATLGAMWTRLSRMKDLLDDEWLTSAAPQLAVAEAWALSPVKVDVWGETARNEWLANLVQQVFNPDPRVRRAMLRHLLDGHLIDELVEAIPVPESPSPALRRTAFQEAEDMIRQWVEEHPGQPIPKHESDVLVWLMADLRVEP